MGMPAPEAGMKVSALAGQRRLGGLLDSRDTRNPRALALRVAAASAVAFVLAIGLWASGWESKAVGWIGIVLLIVGVITAVYAVRTLLQGHKQWFLYEGGLVEVENGKPRAVAWAEVAELEEQVYGPGQLFAGKTGAYQVKPAQGRPIMVRSLGVALPEGELDPFGEHLKQKVAGAGRPIVRRTVGR